MTLEDDELRAAVEDLASDAELDDERTSQDVEDDVALLGLDRQPRGRALRSGTEKLQNESMWSQVRDIVVEVRCLDCVNITRCSVLYFSTPLFATILMLMLMVVPRRR